MTLGDRMIHTRRQAKVVRVDDQPSQALSLPAVRVREVCVARVSRPRGLGRATGVGKLFASRRYGSRIDQFSRPDGSNRYGRFRSEAGEGPSPKA
jgi:hypothetical protein